MQLSKSIKQTWRMQLSKPIKQTWRMQLSKPIKQTWRMQLSKPSKQTWRMQLSKPSKQTWRRVMKTDPWYVLVNLYQTISKVWLWKMVVWQCLSWEVYSCIIVFERAAWGSWVSNMADILTEVMHLYSPGGLTCYWIIRDNKSCIVN